MKNEVLDKASTLKKHGPLVKECGRGLKRVGATCVWRADTVEIMLPEKLSEDMARAAYYIDTLPQRVAKAVAAAEEVIAAFERRGQK